MSLNDNEIEEIVIEEVVNKTLDKVSELNRLFSTLNELGLKVDINKYSITTMGSEFDTVGLTVYIYKPIGKVNAYLGS